MLNSWHVQTVCSGKVPRLSRKRLQFSVLIVISLSWGMSVLFTGSFIPDAVPEAGWRSNSSAGCSCLHVEGSVPRTVVDSRLESRLRRFSFWVCSQVFHVCPQQNSTQRFLCHEMRKHFLSQHLGGWEKEKLLVRHFDLIWEWQPGPCPKASFVGTL